MDAAGSQGTNGLPQRAPWWWYPDAEGRDGSRGEPRLAVRGPAQHWVRAIHVDAPPDIVFAWGDLFMMRKQLKELKRLSEETGSVG